MTALRLATSTGNDIRLSVVVPVHNEADNLDALIAETAAALRGKCSFEIVVIDDASTDRTIQELARLRMLYPQLRTISHDIRSGQSIAVSSGVRAALEPIVVTMDGDGQNDPRFILDLARMLAAEMPLTGLVAGRRVGRKATRFKRLQSRIANAVRASILRDGTTDTGCGLKAFPRDVFLALPVFDSLHRFLPALVRREGYAVAYVDVVDRQRRHGVSKYGMRNRLWVGLLDLAGVWWLIRRRKTIPKIREIQDAGRSVACDRELLAGRIRQ